MEFLSDCLYQFTFTWTIENVDFSPEKPKQSISSPPFVIHALGATKWYLVLLPRGFDDATYMSLFLCRQPENGRIKQVTVNFKFSIETTTTLLQSFKLASGILFEEGDSWGYSRYLRRDHLSKVLSGSANKGLTLRCDIGESSSKIINHKWNETIDFHMMSNNLMTLYRNESFADVTLCCGDNEIKVHRCILAVRLPKLLSHLRLLQNGQLLTFCNIFDISFPVLKSLLFYAYSGKLDHQTSEVTLELLEAAYKYELSDLIRKLRSFPRFCSARTTYNVEHKSIGWSIHKSTLRKNNPSNLVRIIPTDALYTDCIIVSFTLQADIKCRFVENVQMTFQITDLDEESPIYASCRIYLSSPYGNLFGFCKADHLFLSDCKWTLPVGTNKGSFEDVVELRCELDLCDGDNSFAIRDSWIPSHENVTYIDDYSELSITMLGLFSKNHYSDFTIVTEGQTFAVHSAILASRSPVFCKMLECDMLEKNRREVLIKDTSSAIMGLLLSYMYSGVVRDLEYQEAIDLYEIADKYCILILKERCGCILLSKLNSQNVNRLFDLADMHFDRIMTKRIIEYCEKNNLLLEDDETIQI